MAQQFDLVVLGAGNAGQAAAGAARKAGWEVAIVESREVGGVCPNRGCVPKKVLVAAAEALDLIARAEQHHIEVEPPKLDWPSLIERKNGFVGPLPEAMAGSLRKRGIELFEGRGVFTGPRSVAVGDVELQAKQIVVATGSRPRTLPFPGAELLWTSDDILSMTDLPASVVFVGGGVAALEFSHVLRRAGVDVTILETGSRPLSRMDEDLVHRLVEFSRSLGIDIRTDTQVEAVRQAGEAFEVVLAGGDEVLRAERVVNGAGRVANLDNIDIERAGITLERGRVALDPFMRCVDDPNIWVAGDAIPTTAQLSPVATYEGRIVGHNLVHPEAMKRADYSSMPSAVYTIPTLAQVGLTEADARAQGRAIQVKETDMSGWLSSRTYAEPLAYAKVLVDKNDNTIVGAHMLGHGAGDVIHVFALAIAHGITAAELGSRLYAYPTFTNDLKFLIG